MAHDDTLWPTSGWLTGANTGDKECSELPVRMQVWCTEWKYARGVTCKARLNKTD